MADNLPPLPPGFVLEQPSAAAPQVKEPPRNVPPPPPGFVLESEENKPSFGRLAGQVGQGLAKGAIATAGLIGDVGDAITSVTERPMRAGIEAVLGPPTRGWAELPPSPLGSTTLKGVARSAGVIDNPELAPRNTTERYTRSIAEGVGAAAPFGIGSVAGLARAAISGAGAGAGGQAGEDLAPSHPIIGRAVGSLAGGLGTGAVAGLAEKGVNLAAGKLSPLLEAYKDAGVTPRLVGDLSGSRRLQGFQEAVGKTPGGTNRMSDAVKQTVDEFGASVKRQASRLGASTTPAQAGEALQKGAESWMVRWRMASNKAWADVQSLISPMKRVPVAATKDAVDDLNKAMADAPELASVFGSKMFKEIGAGLSKDAADGSLSWGTLHRVRSEVGKLLGQPQLAGDIRYGELKQLYGALTDDMRAAAAAAGGLEKFEAANKLTREGHAYVEGTLSHIIGKNQAPEKAYSWAIGDASKGGTRLAEVQKLGPAFDEVAAVKLRDMAKASAGAQDAAGEAISPIRFLTEMSKLSPEARASLIRDPAVAKKVESLSLVADSMKKSFEMANKSGTAGAQQFHNAMSMGTAAMGAGVGAVAGGGLGAGAGAMAGALIPWATTNLTARALTNPALAKWLAAGDVGPSAVRRLALLAASNPAIREDVAKLLEWLPGQSSRPADTREPPRK